MMGQQRVLTPPRLWTRRRKIIEPKRALILPLGMRGRFKLQAIAPHHGTVRRETPWIDNLILDAGLDRLAASINAIGVCAVGTGNTAPAVSDTQLASLLASTSTTQSSNEVTDTESPYTTTRTVVKRFAQGAAEGNIAEVGIGWAAASLFSRALIVDEEGAPTTLTVLSDEFLDVTYQLIGYPPLADVLDSITITGSGSHDIVYRAARAGSFFEFDDSGGNLLHIETPDSSVAYDGALGLITGTPAGASGASASQADSTYVAGNFFRDHTITWGLGDGNFGGGISAVMLQVGDNIQGTLYFQCSYSPAIAKDNSQTLALNFRTTWGRPAGS